MSHLVITLTPEKSQRILRALQVNQLNLIDFPELHPPMASAKPLIDTEVFSAEELATLSALVGQIPFQRQSGQVPLNRDLRIALLRACQQGQLVLNDVPQLQQAQQSLKRDFTGLPIDSLRLLAKVARCHRNGTRSALNPS